MKAEERLAEIYRKLQERMASIIDENDRNIAKMIRDQMADIHKQTSANLESLRVAMEKFTTEKIFYTEGEIYKNIDHRMEMFEGRMVKLETNFSTFMENKLKDMDRRLREEISLATKDLRVEINQNIDERARQAVNSMMEIVE